MYLNDIELTAIYLIFSIKNMLSEIFVGKLLSSEAAVGVAMLENKLGSDPLRQLLYPECDLQTQSVQKGQTKFPEDA